MLNLNMASLKKLQNTRVNIEIGIVAATDVVVGLRSFYLIIVYGSGIDETPHDVIQDDLFDIERAYLANTRRTFKRL